MIRKRQVSHPLRILDQACSRRRLLGLWIDLLVVYGQSIAPEKLASDAPVRIGTPDVCYDHGEKGGVGDAGAGAEEKVLVA